MSTADEVDVAGLAATINARLAAEARIKRAIGFGWLCAGFAVATCLGGIGAFLAFAGYSYSLSSESAAKQSAKAITDAFARAQIKTTVSGTMSLSPDSALKLSPGQTVKLEDGTIVRLDPNSSVRVVGDLKMPQPSQRQLQPDTTSKSDELPFTSYTIFRSVSYGPGRVETGWNFDLSDTTRPKAQYCSYIQSIDRGA